MNITLSNQILDELDISNLLNLATDSTQFKEINTLSGYGHYRLLKYLSFCFNNSLFIDIGTFKGASAFSLASNSTNKIISFGIEERIIPIMETIKYLPQNINLCRLNNVDFIITNDFTYYLNIILKSELIFLDIDHSGKKEKEFYELLLKNNYKGIMLLDDIYIYKIFQGEKKCLIGMENFWNDIKNNNNVYDISKFGHGPKKAPTGTGLIDFSKEIKLILK